MLCALVLYTTLTCRNLSTFLSLSLYLLLTRPKCGQVRSRAKYEHVVTQDWQGRERLDVKEVRRILNSSSDSYHDGFGMVFGRRTLNIY